MIHKLEINHWGACFGPDDRPPLPRLKEKELQTVAASRQGDGVFSEAMAAVIQSEKPQSLSQRDSEGNLAVYNGGELELKGVSEMVRREFDLVIETMKGEVTISSEFFKGENRTRILVSYFTKTALKALESLFERVHKGYSGFQFDLYHEFKQLEALGLIKLQLTPKTDFPDDFDESEQGRMVKERDRWIDDVLLPQIYARVDKEIKKRYQIKPFEFQVAKQSFQHKPKINGEVYEVPSGQIKEFVTHIIFDEDLAYAHCGDQVFEGGRIEVSDLTPGESIRWYRKDMRTIEADGKERAWTKRTSTKIMRSIKMCGGGPEYGGPVCNMKVARRKIERDLQGYPEPVFHVTFRRFRVADGEYVDFEPRIKSST